ncbi:MAG: DoxX family protein [Pseudonocardiaceae bacterium]
MKALGLSFLGRAADLGPLFIRLGVGLIFAWHGWEKFDSGVINLAGGLTSLNVPFPEVVAWLMVIAEGVGGLLLIIGLFTRFVTLPLIAIMVGAILLVKVDVGFAVADALGAEFDVALLAGLLGLLFIGPGRLSLDGALGLAPSAAPLTPRRGTSAAA